MCAHKYKINICKSGMFRCIGMYQPVLILIVLEYKALKFKCVCITTYSLVMNLCIYNYDLPSDIIVSS